jgi:hypothetical protein
VVNRKWTLLNDVSICASCSLFFRLITLKLVCVCVCVCVCVSVDYYSLLEKDY